MSRWSQIDLTEPVLHFTCQERSELFLQHPKDVLFSQLFLHCMVLVQFLAAGGGLLAESFSSTCHSWRARSNGFVWQEWTCEDRRWVFGPEEGRCAW